jgi:membrane protein implicated in regulation of membrane protease activity
MNRLWLALGAYAVLAAVAWTTLRDERFKIATVAILAMFAIRTWSWSRKQDREQRDRRDED